MTEVLATKASQLGIKELKDVLEAILEMSVKIAAVLKDGYQPSDLGLIFDLFTKDDEMKNKIAAAYDGISKVGGEIGDLDIYEGIELSISLMKYVPKFVDALKKVK